MLSECGSMIVPVLLYFAYGSNMLADRFFVQNNGTRIGYGRLDGYRLAFNHFTPYWDGAGSTIFPDKNNFVLGAIWKVSASDFQSLDK